MAREPGTSNSKLGTISPSCYLKMLGTIMRCQRHGSPYFYLKNRQVHNLLDRFLDGGVAIDLIVFFLKSKCNRILSTFSITQGLKTKLIPGGTLNNLIVHFLL